MQENFSDRIFPTKYSDHKDEFNGIAEYFNTMEQLRRLDAGVTKKGSAAAIAIGVISVIIMGAGMSLVMTDIGEIIGLSYGYAMVLGIFVGFAGIVGVGLAYPVYNRIVKKERERIAPEILRLTDELMK